jgi:hypothetical protein
MAQTVGYLLSKLQGPELKPQNHQKERKKRDEKKKPHMKVLYKN